jgi:hypothetical protein
MSSTADILSIWDSDSALSAKLPPMLNVIREMAWMRLLFVCIVTGVFSMPIYAQSSSEVAKQTPTTEQQPAKVSSQASVKSAEKISNQPIKLGKVIVNISIRTRMEAWDFFSGPALGDNQYTFTPTQIRFSLNQNTKTFDWMLEGEVPILPYLPSSTVVAPPAGQLGLGASYYAANGSRQTVVSIFPKQAFVRFKPGGGPTSLRLGRFEFIDGIENKQKDASLGFLKRDRLGSHLLGNFGFTHVGRAFDGAELMYDNSNNNYTLFAGRVTRGVFQADGLGELDVDVLFGAWSHQVKVAKKHIGEFKIFSMMYHDGRSAPVKVDSRPAAIRAADHGNIRLGTYGIHYAQLIESTVATWDALFWGALQSGSWGSLPHFAGSASIEAGVQPHVKGKPWLRGGFDYASGTGSTTPSRHTTFVFPLGTPRIYARFPYYNAMNMKDAFGMFLLRPDKKVTIRTEFHNLHLSSASDLWYAGGGAFQKQTFGFTGRPSNGSNDLGNMMDVGVDWIVRPHLTISPYYAHAWGGTVIQKIFSVKPTADYFYLELAVKY